MPLISFPDIEHSWELAEKVLEVVSYKSNLQGIHKLRDQWINNKWAKLGHLFDKDGRKQEEMPVGLSTEMFNELFSSTRNLFHELDLEIPDIIKLLSADEFKQNRVLNPHGHGDLKNYVGMKLSKFLTRNYIPKDQVDEFNIRFSMIIQSAKQTGTLIVSINPLDILLISHMGITSCHRLGSNIDGAGAGEYAAGTLQYLVDRYTAVSYLTNNHMKPVSINHTNCDFQYPFKLWRQLCYIDVNNLSALFMRQYMNDHEDAHALARKMVARALRGSIGKPKIGWTKTVSNDGQDLKDLIYNESDLAYIDPPSSMIKLKHPDAGAPDITLDIEPYCPVCGESKITESKALVCNNCNNIKVCLECDKPYQGDEMYEYDGCYYCPDCYHDLFESCTGCYEVVYKAYMYYFNNEWYCYSCVDNVSVQCSICGEREDRDYAVTLDNGEYLCRNCQELHTGTCDECGDYYYNSDLDECDGVTLCEECASSLVDACYECNDSHLISSMKEFDDDYYCTDCYTKVIYECAKCNKLDNINYMHKYEGNNYCLDCYTDIGLDLKLPNPSPAPSGTDDRLQEVV